MKRPIFSDGLAVGLIRLAFRPIEWALEKIEGEPAKAVLDQLPEPEPKQEKKP